ncbi:rubrerythrin family protein [Methanobacterium alkalithermotolerans]|uniref:Rubrerythrin family protein n=1 Tax=Methanobacterium alkalithermotolerans TaxID=2731220 RepID=A0A8T8K4T5_9EURY|nr:rubrerythrin family protein [Methanobacterium alkalithermotolerans]QUH22892.1 rubrerythrin family protein [Methanobacterium alkalithermotolerans]
MSNIENLKEAFSGESQANRKYLAFAKKADQEGYPHIARLFRAAAAAETVHAHNHLDAMGGIKSTEENLKTAIEGEIAEFEEMYPDFIEEAKEEGNKQAEWTFDVANQVEKIHAQLYQKALENIESKVMVDYYVCNWCGNTVEEKPPEKCPICNAPVEEFLKVD